MAPGLVFLAHILVLAFSFSCHSVLGDQLASRLSLCGSLCAY